MPFKSQVQRGYMFKYHPTIARRWAHESKGGRKLPAVVRKNPKKTRRRKK